MNLLDILAGPVFGKVIDRIFPDPAAKAAAQLEILKLNQAGEFKELDAQLQQNLAQAEINKIEAANPSTFVSGWRPGMGWCCVAIYACAYILAPLLSYTLQVIDAIHRGVPIPAAPVLDTMAVAPVLLGMLGLAGARSYEKVNGVASK